jgi:hypothetical protein
VFQVKSTFTALAAAAVLCLAGGSNAAAQEMINKDGMTGPEVAAWLQAAGFKAELTKDKTGDPMIRSAAGGVNFTVLFYDCDKGRCRALQFSSGFDLSDGLTLAKTNEWNKKYRYLKAYLDDENDPYVEYDVNLNAGRTMAGLKDDFDIWTDMLGDFATFIDW